MWIAVSLVVRFGMRLRGAGWFRKRLSMLRGRPKREDQQHERDHDQKRVDPLVGFI
jgi:hypothetical protein